MVVETILRIRGLVASIAEVPQYAASPAVEKLQAAVESLLEELGQPPRLLELGLDRALELRLTGEELPGTLAELLRDRTGARSRRDQQRHDQVIQIVHRVNELTELLKDAAAAVL
jgi:alcohol dehydrogenase class IV